MFTLFHNKLKFPKNAFIQITNCFLLTIFIEKIWKTFGFLILNLSENLNINKTNYIHDNVNKN